MERRHFLRLSALAAAGAVVGACGKTKTKAIKTSPFPEIFKGIVTKAGHQTRPRFQVFPGASLYIEGRRARFPFRILKDDEGAVDGGTGSVWVGQNNRVQDPVEIKWNVWAKPEGFNQGFHEALLPAMSRGVADIAVQVDKGLFGFAVIEVVEEGPTLDVDDKMPALTTPIDGDTRGVENLCTRDPVCGMHSISLDKALTMGKPVVLTVASPKFCTSRVCGPVLEEIVAARSSVGDAAIFVHAEPFATSAPTELSPTANALQIPTEPWTFVINSDGVITHSLEGATTSTHVLAALK